MLFGFFKTNFANNANDKGFKCEIPSFSLIDIGIKCITVSEDNGILAVYDTVDACSSTCEVPKTSGKHHVSGAG